MPHLNWRTAPIGKAVLHKGQPGGQPDLMTLEREFQLELRVPLSTHPALMTELLSKLAETYAAGAGELRVDLPDEWIVFWKVRDGESRLLIAHPQKDEWVTTAALEASHGTVLLGALQGLSVGGKVVVGDLGSVVGGVSNVEIVIRAD